MDAVLVNTVYSFILITIRFGSLFLATPMFASMVIPMQVKAGLSLLMSLILYPIVFVNGPISFPDHILQVVFQAGNEVLIGVILGFVAYLTFSTIHLAGQLMDLRMGFAMVNVVDPFTGSDAPLMGQFKNIIALLVLLTINGHHQMLLALIKSFELLPIAKPVLNSGVLSYIFRVGGDIFLIGFRLALPVVAVLFIVDVIFGFLARTVPQMNVFIMGFPIKILLGFLVLFMAWPFMISYLVDIIQLIIRQMAEVLNLMR